jgi:hypothetical protein
MQLRIKQNKKRKDYQNHLFNEKEKEEVNRD